MERNIAVEFERIMVPFKAGISLNELAQSIRFRRGGDLIDECYFPKTCRLKPNSDGLLAIDLARFSANVSTTTAGEILRAWDRTPGYIHPLLALAKAFPDVPLGAHGMVAAVGLVAEIGDARVFPCLSGTSDERIFHTQPENRTFGTHWRFLCLPVTHEQLPARPYHSGTLLMGAGGPH
jgi:hypothetical protein